jgi:hypothetical protein
MQLIVGIGKAFEITPLGSGQDINAGVLLSHKYGWHFVFLAFLSFNPIP